MIAAIQYNLFEETPSETCLLRLDLTATAESLTKVRRGTYARLNVHEKRLLELEEDIAILKKVLCKSSSQ